MLRRRGCRVALASGRVSRFSRTRPCCLPHQPQPRLRRIRHLPVTSLPPTRTLQRTLVSHAPAAWTRPLRRHSETWTDSRCFHESSTACATRLACSLLDPARLKDFGPGEKHAQGKRDGSPPAPFRPSQDRWAGRQPASGRAGREGAQFGRAGGVWSFISWECGVCFLLAAGRWGSSDERREQRRS